ncbi:60S ribosomal protein L12 [Astathelohania contejeani]|uniref:60S ribosomal protein L12 n=1 Tax=Astathelohania contejeani TaxID=164912 RepID=A0ABQ7HYR8_9MICR|nr:60S ribosomal protein L12 [Thelohania contejeani]
MAQPPVTYDDGSIVIELRCVGGEAPGPTLAQKVGPLGIPAKVVGEDIKKATMDFLGLKVNVRLIIKDRKARIELIPNSATLILKALREPPRDRKKEKNITHHGSITMTDVVEVARAIKPKSKCNEFAGVIKSVLGTCVSIGCTIEGRNPKEVIGDIAAGRIRCPTE